MKEKQNHYDIVVVGSGCIGLSIACALAQYNFKVALIDMVKPETTTTEDFDGRVFAISHSTKQFFDSIDIWPRLSHFAQPIHKIHVTDSPLGKKSPFFLHFNENDSDDMPMGYMIENRFIRKVLLEQALQADLITLMAPHKVHQIDHGSAFSSVKLDNGKNLTAQLVIAADGRNSQLRSQAGIDIYENLYDQMGIVAYIEHEYPHNGVAYECFFPSGPFAILPMINHGNKNMSSIVWTEETKKALAYVKLNETRFLDQIKLRFGDFLGKIETTGKRWHYPLKLTVAKKYTHKRLCLIGDSAHAIHPIAGQGLNLSVRDVACLVEILYEQKKLGLDIGSQNALNEYENSRKLDNKMMIWATDRLNQLFSNDSQMIFWARSVGLGIVNRIPSLRKKFVQYAMGKYGNLGARHCKMLRGEKLN